MAGKKSAKQVMDEWAAKMADKTGAAIDGAGAAIDSIPPVREMPALAAGKVLQGGAAVGNAIGSALDADNARFGSAMGVAGDVYKNQAGQGYLGQTMGKIGNAGLGAVQGGMDLASGEYDRRGYDFAPGEAAGYGMMGDARNAINQLGYDVKLGAQQGRFPPNPPAPYVDANSMVDSMSGTIGANAELPNMMKGHGTAYRGIGIANQQTEQLQQQQMQQQQEMQAIAMKLQEAGIPVTSETVQRVMEQKKMMGGFLQEKAGQGMDAMRGLLQ